MQCPCGGSTKTTHSTKRDENAKLEYQQCSGCGRVGGFILSIDQGIAAKGIAAQKWFLELPGKQRDKPKRRA